MDPKVWECSIGGAGFELPPGADAPLRNAVAKAYLELTGKDPEFCFSGWGGRLSDVQVAVLAHQEGIKNERP